MKEVFYKGDAYACEIVDMGEKRLFVLYKNGEQKHYVKEEDLDIRSRVSMILDAYYSNARSTVESTVLN